MAMISIHKNTLAFILRIYTKLLGQIFSPFFFIWFCLKFMKLDGKAIQAAMMELIDDYKLDPNQLLDISMQ
jgi:hypothetical protein